LGITTDELVFGPDARGPDQDLRLQHQSGYFLCGRALQVRLRPITG
jgi:hypothetical protein